MPFTVINIFFATHTLLNLPLPFSDAKVLSFPQVTGPFRAGVACPEYEKKIGSKE
jgi:hypothetical protein